jgi:hypothetical protein
MSTDPSFQSPILSYLGSVDVSTSSAGTTNYTILVDPSMSTVGNILMFEWKIQNTEDSTIPSNLKMGFLTVESGTCSQSGISNQWILAVPALDNSLNDVNEKISVRVYSGLIGKNEVGVSPWSNELTVHNPPAQPTIVLAFFEPTVDNSLNNLEVVINDSETYDASTNFIIAYYYDDLYYGTVWKVTDPIVPQDITYGGIPSLLITQNYFGVVSSSQVVYVCVYAVNSFTDASGNNFYAVSQISSENENGGAYSALPVSQYESPTITDISYSVYQNETQNMTVFWEAPAASSVPNIFDVSYYQLERSSNEGLNWLQIYESSNSTSFSFEDDVSSIATCNTIISYRVRAIGINQEIGPWSPIDSLNIFKYSDAVTNLATSDTSYSNGTLTTTVSFTKPSITGCGTPLYYEVIFTDASNQTSTTIINVVNGQTNYSQELSFTSLTDSGTVSVSLYTRDTNSLDAMKGEEASTSYLATSLILNDISYAVYVNETQDMYISWNDIMSLLPSGWQLIKYQVFLIVDDQEPTVIAEYTEETSISHIYTADQDCETQLQFYVKAIVESDTAIQYPITSGTKSINIFKWPEAPNLEVTYSSFPNTTLGASLTTSFNMLNVSIGCGEAHEYHIIYDSANFPNEIKHEVNYGVTSDSVQGVGLEQTGTIKIYLSVFDTNNGGQELFMSPNLTNVTTIAYVSNDLVLSSDFDYDFTNQDVTHYWNSIVYSPFTTVTYKLYRKPAGGSFTEIASTTNTNANTSFPSSCGEYIYYVEGTLTDGVSTQTFRSNEVSVYRYQSPSQPSFTINWASSNLDKTFNDFSVTITSNSELYCSTTGAYYTLSIYDNSSVEPLHSVDYPIELGTKRINNITYVLSGRIELIAYTKDANDNEFKPSATASQDYYSSSNPLIKNVVRSDSLLTFYVYTQDTVLDLSRYGKYIDIGGVGLVEIKTATDGSHLTVTKTQLSNMVQEYYFVMSSEYISSGYVFPSSFGLTFGNDHGLGYVQYPILL